MTLLLPLLLAAALPLAARAQTWGSAAPLPFARSDHTATTLGNAIYLAGGCDGAQKCQGAYCSCTSITRNFVAFTPATGAYAPRAPMLQPRYRHLACPLLNNAGLVLFGGRTLVGSPNSALSAAALAANDALVTAIDVYTVANNSWTTLGVAYPADVGSDNSCTTAPDGRIYVMGGYSPDYLVSSRKVYALTLGGAGGGAFAPMAPMPLGLGDFSSVLVPATGNIHIMGGYTTEADPANWFCRPLTAHYIYSPAANTWSAGPPLPMALAEKDDAVLLGGRLFTLGGEIKARDTGCTDPDIIALTTVFSYDPAARQWRNETFLPSGTMRLAGAELGGVAYLFGGQGAIIDGQDTLPLKYEVLTYSLAPPSAPAAAPVTYTAGAMAGAVVGTMLGTLVAAAAAQAIAARCSGGGSGGGDGAKNVFSAA